MHATRQPPRALSHHPAGRATHANRGGEVAAGNAGSKKEEEPVRTFVKLAVLAGAAAALACDGRGREPGTDELSADLRRDLDLASSASLGLASSAHPYQRMRVVSAVEALPVGHRPTSTAKAPRPRRA